MSCPSNSTFPLTLAPVTSSCMRLRHRTRVDFPQPDGPIMAVTDLASAEKVTSLSPWLVPNQALRAATSTPPTRLFVVVGSTRFLLSTETAKPRRTAVWRHPQTTGGTGVNGSV